MNNYH